MQTIVDSSPLSRPSVVTVAAGQSVALLHRQAIVWMSIAPRNVIQLPTAWPRFPAVLDTGFNASFLISQRQLHDWAGVELDQLVLIPPGRTGWRKIYNQPISSYQATLWMHRNAPGQRDELTTAEPVTLYPSAGILVSPLSNQPTRLPLIGMELLESCGLQVSLDPQTIDPVLPLFEMRFSIRSVLEV